MFPWVKMIGGTKVKLKTLFLVSLLGLFFVSDTHAIVLTKEKDTTSQKQGSTRPLEKAWPLPPDSFSQKDSSTPEYAPGEIIIKFSPETKEQIRQMLTSSFTKGLQSKDKFEKPIDFNANLISSHINNIDITILKDINTKYKAKVEPICKSLHRQLHSQGKDFYQLETDKLLKNKKAQTLTQAQDKAKMLPDFSSIYVLKIQGDVQEAVTDYNQLKDKGILEYVEPNYKAKVQMVPNDPYYRSRGSWGQSYDDLWGLKKIQSEQAWNISQGKDVVVAVIDTGIDYNHEDIAPNIWINTAEIPNNGIDDDGNGYIDDVRGWDFSYLDNDPMDGYGHGTHCAGTIAAVGNNNKGVIGVAPQAKVMAVKGLDDSGAGLIDDLANALIYAADNGAKVLSNSWGGGGYFQLIEDAVNYAYAKDCVILAAAGNDDTEVSYFFPANCSNVIAIGSTDHNDLKSDFSNYGDKIDVVAPGGDSSLSNDNGALYRNILSLRASGTDMYGNGLCIVGNNYYRLRGTSMACPHVAGVAALILSANFKLTNHDVRSTLRTSADDIGEAGKDSYFGYGRVNAYKACLISPAYLKSPVNNSFIRGRVGVIGNTVIPAFERYELYFAPKNNPQKTTLVNSSSTSANGLLGVWDTIVSSEGKYILTLKITTTDNTNFFFNKDITIDNINELPVFRPISNKGAVIGRLLGFKIEAHDPDDPDRGGSLIYSARNLPPGAQFVPETQQFTWHPTESDKGIYYVNFIVGDGQFTVNKEISISTVYLQEIQITSDSAYQQAYSIYADKIVYEDYKNGYSNPDIYMYDISTGQETQITTNIYRQCTPDIYGDKIIWCDDRASGGSDKLDIFMHNLSTGQEVQITNSPSYKFQPHISQDKIVWQENNLSGKLDICMYNLLTGQETKIMTDLANGSFLAIDADKVVYSDWRSGNMRNTCSNIYMYDLLTERETPITINSANQLFPDISQDKIVWSGINDGNWDIFMHDLSTSQKIQITSNSGENVTPAIFSDKIVWIGIRNENQSDVYMHDLSTSQEIQITPTYYRYPTPPFVFEDRIVWTGSNKKNTDVYMAKLAFVPQIASIAPTEVFIGDSFTITGINFGYNREQDSKVEFSNGVFAQIETWSNTQITCRVPQGARTGLVSVVTLGGQSNGVMVTIDTTSPPTPIVTDGGEFTRKNQLYASWTSSDPESGIQEYQYKITQDSTTGTVICNWTSTGRNAYVTAGPKNLTHGKTYYFGVKAKNGAGLWSDIGYSDGITLDTLSPQGTLKINNDAIYTNSTSVTLTISATDTGSGMGQGAQMRFSNHDATWTNPEAYSSTKSWALLPGDGKKIVYVTFKDVIGNWSKAYIDGVFLDTTIPVLKNMTRSPQSRRRPVLFQAEIKDNLSGVASASVSVKGSTYLMNYNPRTKLYEANVSIWLPKNIPGVFLEYSINAKDKAGNRITKQDRLSLM